MTQPGIEPKSSGLLANTLLTWTISRYISVYSDSEMSVPSELSYEEMSLRRGISHKETSIPSVYCESEIPIKNREEMSIPCVFNHGNVSIPSVYS